MSTLIASLAVPVAPWRRLGRLAAALLHATPVHALAYSLLFVCSQTFLLAALLLPWKLLTVMATQSVPSFVPSGWGLVTVRELVIALSAGSVASLVLYGVCELAMARVALHGSRAILNRNDKVALFDRHEQHAAALYRHFLRGQAAVLGVVIVVLCLAWLYPLVLGSLLVYLAFGILVVTGLRSNATVGADPALTPGLVANAWWGAGFIFAVGWVVWDHLQGTLPQLLVVFVSLLMLRQALVLCALIFRTHVLFTRQVQKAEALFLSHVTWHPAQRGARDFLGLADPDRRQIWVAEALKPHLGTTDAVIAVTECTPTENGQVLLVVAVCNEPGRLPSAFLLKLFHASRKDRAQHERDLLQHAASHWPAPALLAAQSVQGNTCLVYAWDAEAEMLTGRERTAAAVHLREAFMACEPPPELVERYARSRPHLAERLGSVHWAELACVVSPGQDDVCDRLQAIWPHVQDAVRAVPGQLMVPSLSSYRVDRVGGKTLIRNWTCWAWEPVGAGWPARAPAEQLEAALLRAPALRPALQHVGVVQARLVAVAYEFDRLWSKHDYAGAAQLMPHLLEAALGTAAPKQTPPQSFEHVSDTVLCRP